MKATKLSYYSDQLIFSRLVPTIVLLHFLTIVLSQTNKAGFHINSFSDSGSEYNATSISNEWNVRKLREKNYSDLQASPLPEPIHHPCDELLNETSEAFGDFYKCSIHHARPYRFCEKCSQVYIKAISVYKNIQFTVSKKKHKFLSIFYFIFFYFFLRTLLPYVKNALLLKGYFPT